MLTNVRIEEVRATLAPLRRVGKRIGLVPTMGYLHDGHMALMRRARQENDCVVASIFVNPIQFGANEDLSRYPRDLERDSRMLAAAGVDLLFAPTVEVMYPRPTQTFVDVPGLGGLLEGGVRPGHFQGVATVVTKLFNIVQPDTAYFGEKDYQQLQVIKRMARDLDIPVAIEGCPTVRENDGLAMSSRNAYLSADERRIAARLNHILHDAIKAVHAGAAIAATEAEAARHLLAAGFTSIDYIAIRDAQSLAPIADLARPARILAAAWLGKTRLIDNMAV